MLDSHRFKNYKPSNCYHLACSEIRAVNLNDTCSGSFRFRYLLGGHKHNKGYFDECVYRNALINFKFFFEHCNGK